MAAGFVHQLANNLNHNGDKLAIGVFDKDCQLQQTICYQQLRQLAIATQLWLQRATEPGARVIVAVEDPGVFAGLALGLLLSDRLLVPAPAPRQAGAGRKLQAMIHHCQPGAVLVEHETLLPDIGRESDFPCQWAVAETILGGQVGDHSLVVTDNPHRIIQYSSGSTGDPKGIVLSDGNLSANSRFIQQRFEHSEETRVVSWLPLFHDMGLIGGLLQPLFVGGTTYLTTTTAFTQAPWVWLQAIAQFAATSSGAPNFAFDLCHRMVQPQHLQGLSLEHWQLAFCGAERISANVLNRFADKFSAYGFSPKALFPCYGMAESSLMVSSVEKSTGLYLLNTGTSELDDIPGCGTTDEQAVLAIRPLQGTHSPRGPVTGEIMIGGASVSYTRWEPHSQTAERLDIDGLLPTGDIGFIEHGHLFVVGRLKEMINIAGVNVSPEDIEQVVIASAPLHPKARVVAIAQTIHGTEAPTLIVESRTQKRDQLIDMANSLKAAIASELQLSLATVVFVPIGGIARTTSGKLRRLTCKQMFDQGQLKSILAVPFMQASAESASIELANVLSVVANVCGLPVDSISGDDSLLDIACDSLSVFHILSQMQAEVSRDVGLDQLLALPLRSWPQCLGKISDSTAVTGTDTPVLTIGQREILTRLHLDDHIESFWLHSGFRLSSPLSMELLTSTLTALLKRYSLLSARLQGPAYQKLQLHSSDWLEYLVYAQVADETLLDNAHQAFIVQKPSWQGGALFQCFYGESPMGARLTFRLHHLLCDFWSASSLLDTFLRLLRGDCRDLPATALLPAKLVNNGKAPVTQYTLRQDAIELYCPQNPKDRKVPASAVKVCPSSIVPALSALAVTEQCTRYQLLIAVFSAWLARMSGKSDLMFGTTVSGRPLSPDANLFSCFSRVIPVQLSVAEGDSLKTISSRMHRCLQMPLSASIQQQPLQLVNEAQEPIRRFPYHVVFNHLQTDKTMAAFVLNVGECRLSGGELELTALAGEVHKPIADVQFDLIEVDQRLWIRMVSNVAPTWYLQQLVDEYIGLLSHWMRDIHRPLADYSLAFPAYQTNQGDVCHEFVTQQIERQCKTKPDNIAIEHGEVSLSYRQLMDRVNQTADVLLGAGLRKGQPVALQLLRNTTMLITILALLKENIPYVPIGLQEPDTRFTKILEAVKPLALLEDAPEGVGIRILNSAAGVWNQDIAYCLFTSGSTGQPKGIQIRHSALANLAAWSGTYFDYQRQPRVLLSTAYTWDLFAYEFLCTLTNGGTVVLVDHLFELLDHKIAVDVINTVPSAMKRLLAAQAVPATASVINLAGEVLDRGVVEQLYRLPGVERVNNLYGPSETTTYSSAFFVPKPVPEAIPIGQPLLNTRLMVVSDQGQVLPRGTVGTLAIGGEGLAASYIGVDESQQRAFVDHHGARYFMTGDRVWMDTTGCLHFLGRQDNQVKIHGHRIELEEIEAIVMALPRVADVALTVYCASGEARLVMLLVLQESAGQPDLEQMLNSALPAYMMPWRWHLVESIPRNANGKIDRQQLLPMYVTLQADEELIAGNTQEKDAVSNGEMHKIWQRILKRNQPIEASDNFFNLGGDSMAAIELVSMARDAGYQLAAKTLFEHPIFSDFVAAVAKKGRVGMNDPLALSVPQQWLLSTQLHQPNQWNQSLLLSCDATLDVDEVSYALTQLLEQLPSLNSRFVDDGKSKKRVITDKPEREGWPVWQVDQKGLAQLANQMNASLSVQQGNTFDAALCRVDTEERLYILMIAHHLVCDLHSWVQVLSTLQSSVVTAQPQMDVTLMPQLSVQTRYAPSTMMFKESTLKRLNETLPALENLTLEDVLLASVMDWFRGGDQQEFCLIREVVGLGEDETAAIDMSWRTGFSKHQVRLEPGLKAALVCARHINQNPSIVTDATKMLATSLEQKVEFTFNYLGDINTFRGIHPQFQIDCINPGEVRCPHDAALLGIEFNFWVSGKKLYCQVFSPNTSVTAVSSDGQSYKEFFEAFINRLCDEGNVDKFVDADLSADELATLISQLQAT